MAAKRTSKGRKTGKSSATRKTAAKSGAKRTTRSRASAASKSAKSRSTRAKSSSKRKGSARGRAKAKGKSKKKASSGRISAPKPSGRRTSRAVGRSMARSGAEGRATKPAARAGPSPRAGKVRTSASHKGGGAELRETRPGTRIPHIDDATLARIEGKLGEMRAESLAIVNRQMASDLRPKSSETEVGDDMDLASQDRDREFDLLMHERHLRRIQQIDEAFQRIKDGTYGLCEGTDEPINPKRLEINPLARFSIEYQQEQEKMLGRTPEEFFFEEESSFEAEEE